MPRVLTFSTHNLPIPLPKYEQFRERGERSLERTLPELARDRPATAEAEHAARTPAAPPSTSASSKSSSMFLLPMLAVALGIPPKRSTSALGVFLSIVMIVDLSQGERIRAGDRQPRADRSDHCAVGAVRDLRRAGAVDVPQRRLCPRRPADRRARTVFDKASKAIRALLPGRRRKTSRRPRRDDLLNFFPSRTMSLYMGKMFLIRTFAILAALVLVLQALDLLSESGDILAVCRQWRCRGVALRRPAHAADHRDASCPSRCCSARSSRCRQLNQNSEVIAMKAAGLSAHQVLAPLIVDRRSASRWCRSRSTTASSARATATLEHGRRSNTAPCRSIAATAPMSGCATATI